MKRVVAFSSTSRFTKQGSSSPRERETARRLAEAEEAVERACRERRIRWTILRPTLVYGGGRDRNVSAIARFVRRFGFFPIAGEGRGKRQPVHAADLARAALAVLDNPATFDRAYDTPGGETLTLRRDGVPDRARGRPDAEAGAPAAASSPRRARRGEPSPRPRPRDSRHGRPHGRGPGVRRSRRPPGLRLRSPAVPLPRRARRQHGRRGDRRTGPPVRAEASGASAPAARPPRAPVPGSLPAPEPRRAPSRAVLGTRGTPPGRHPAVDRRAGTRRSGKGSMARPGSAVGGPPAGDDRAPPPRDGSVARDEPNTISRSTPAPDGSRLSR